MKLDEQARLFGGLREVFQKMIPNEYATGTSNLCNEWWHLGNDMRLERKSEKPTYSHTSLQRHCRASNPMELFALMRSGIEVMTVPNPRNV